VLNHASDLRLGADAPSPLRVIVISRICFYREGLAQLLERRGFTVCGALAPDGSGIERVIADPPDVILVDISSAEGMAALRALAEHTERIRTVAAAVSCSDAEIVECAHAGATGYVSTDASSEELVSILTSAARGEMRCPPFVAAVLRRRMTAMSAPGAGARLDVRGAGVRLTNREVEIVRLLERALSNKEIARHLGIEVSTVKSHVHSILEKLRVGRRRDAVARLRDRRRDPDDALLRLT
jgi:two-component system, NarL family, nitrate/nitrite response regulator NarL